MGKLRLDGMGLPGFCPLLTHARGLLTGIEKLPTRKNDGINIALPESEPCSLPSSIEGAPSPMEVVQVARDIITESTVNENGYVYLFQLEGENGGLFYLDLKNGKGCAEEGHPPYEPDITFTMSVSDMQNIIMGNTRPFQAYMSGRMKASGDLSLALSLEDFGKKVVERIRADANK